MFTYLPLHAAGATGPYVQSYTLTLDALIRARERPAPLVTSVAPLAVPEIPGRPDLALPCVTKELEKIESVINKHSGGGVAFTNLTEYQTTTISTLLAHIQTAPWLHLACHGEQDLQNPLDSKLLLRDGAFRLGEIVGTKTCLSDASFVFLSACQTAMGDGKLVNEGMHMAGAFITAGFRGAVGALWSMADVDGPVVAEVFYRTVFGAVVGATAGSPKKQPSVECAAEGLKAAVDELRKRGVPFERWMPFVHFGI